MVERRGSLTDSRSKSVSITDSFKPECEQIELDLRERLKESIYTEISPNDLVVYLKVLYKLSNLKMAEEPGSSS